MPTYVKPQPRLIPERSKSPICRAAIVELEGEELLRYRRARESGYCFTWPVDTREFYGRWCLVHDALADDDLGCGKG